MHLQGLLQNRRANHGTRLGSLALALVLAATLVAPAARAAERLRDRSATLSAPPSYPDAVHVFNGCHLSTLRYLSQFLSEFPQERGEPLTVKMMEADGNRRFHTVALISWHGQSWCRDEYFGVFFLSCQVEPQPNFKPLAARVETLLHEQARRVIRTAGMPPRRKVPEQMSAEQRIGEVTAAARIIPYPTTIFWVRSGNRELPLAFFRPTGQLVAVYDPLHGTALAECPSSNDAKVVSSMAEKLGYRPEGVRRCNSAPSGVLVAAAVDTSHAYAAQ